MPDLLYKKVVLIVREALKSLFRLLVILDNEGRHPVEGAGNSV